MDVDLLHEEMSVLDSVDDFSDTHSQCSTVSQDPDTSRTHLSISTIGGGHPHKSLFRDKSMITNHHCTDRHNYVVLM